MWTFKEVPDPFEPLYLEPRKQILLGSYIRSLQLEASTEYEYNQIFKD